MGLRQHVAFVYDSAKMTQSIYLDGLLDKTCAEPELHYATRFLPTSVCS